LRGKNKRKRKREKGKRECPLILTFPAERKGGRACRLGCQPFGELPDTYAEQGNPKIGDAGVY
jgi:hypothetical protein